MATWVTRQASPISVEPIGEFRAIYLEANGMTHLVDPVSAEVLSFVASAPRSLSEIRSHVADFVGDLEISESEITEGLLSPLQSVGLVEALAS